MLDITDGWKVHPCFINDCDHLILKTAMSRVEGENWLLCHYLARLDCETIGYSKPIEMLIVSNLLSQTLDDTSFLSHHLFSVQRLSNIMLVNYIC